MFDAMIHQKIDTEGLSFEVTMADVEELNNLAFNDVLDGTFDAGVIIHENRFTYHERGLHKIIDLGEFWQQFSNAPIPLGGIVAHRRLDTSVQQRLNSVMRRSIEFAFANPDKVMPFVRQHAQEMSEEVMKKHIALYVNKYSLNLGLEGRQAILLMLNHASSLGLVTNMNPDIFITNEIS
jgi:1,4-dihydroxy-6-naphthoate synthase